EHRHRSFFGGLTNDLRDAHGAGERIAKRTFSDKDLAEHILGQLDGSGVLAEGLFECCTGAQFSHHDVCVGGCRIEPATGPALFHAGRRLDWQLFVAALDGDRDRLALAGLDDAGDIELAVKDLRLVGPGLRGIVARYERLTVDLDYLIPWFESGLFSR